VTSPVAASPTIFATVAQVDVLGADAGRIADGMELRLRSPWYRSLPLSSITIELTVDGEDVAAERLRFHVNDRTYRLDELEERWDEVWFVLDPGRLRVQGVEPGAHDVDLRLSLRIPYLFDEETGDVLVIRTAGRRTVSVPEQARA
jgi:hypothetical protein